MTRESLKMVSLIDVVGQLRLIVQDIERVKPILPMPNLLVPRVMWKSLPDLTTGVKCWITAGGAHHTVLSYDVSTGMLRDWARMMDIEFVHIGAGSTPEALERELFYMETEGVLSALCRRTEAFLSGGVLKGRYKCWKN